MPGSPAQDRRPKRLIDLGAAIHSSIGRSLFGLIKGPIEQAFSVSTINDIYTLASPSAGDHNYFATALRISGVSYDLAPEDLAKIPATGPLVVVANHPFGAADGLIMGDIEYLVRNAECKILFGPVSISRAYAGLSRRLMVEFLSKLRGGHELGPLVKPRNPPRERLRRRERDALDALVRDTEDVSALVSDIEIDRKGLPVLLRHYLRLGASMLSFNVDAGFGNCIDGLIIVDLRATDPQILRRYMGHAGYQRYAGIASPTPARSVA